MLATKLLLSSSRPSQRRSSIFHILHGKTVKGQSSNTIGLIRFESLFKSKVRYLCCAGHRQQAHIRIESIAQNHEYFRVSKLFCDRLSGANQSCLADSKEVIRHTLVIAGCYFDGYFRLLDYSLTALKLAIVTGNKRSENSDQRSENIMSKNESSIC